MASRKKKFLRVLVSRNFFYSGKQDRRRFRANKGPFWKLLITNT